MHACGSALWAANQSTKSIYTNYEAPTESFQVLNQPTPLPDNSTFTSLASFNISGISDYPLPQDVFLMQGFQF